ncbi:hypothetical protein DAPK24_013000 [Pichia kluyveri]|uniref:BHLH domain-containing protein n=1 Tax=Pichia kluyveri TaxID=36015 RepID=A0AAV5QZX0_PICKL|nr:hypothetical protein DAPK24_013000 [Pichia kluyveri]
MDFDFDAIGHLLLSPGLNQSNNFQNFTNDALSPGLLPNLSFTPPFSSIPLNDIHHDDNYLNDNNNNNNINININNPLLTTSESMALESFLDSIIDYPITSDQPPPPPPTAPPPPQQSPLEQKLIPTEPPLKKQKISKQKQKQKRHQTKPKKEQEQESKQSKESHIDTAAKRALHNETERLRRNAIKSAFNDLQELLNNSNFNLEEETQQLQQHQQQISEEPLTRRQQKRRLSSRSKASNSTKKAVVLNMAVVEISLLLEENEKLRRLVS